MVNINIKIENGEIDRKVKISSDAEETILTLLTLEDIENDIKHNLRKQLVEDETNE